MSLNISETFEWYIYVPVPEFTSTVCLPYIHLDISVLCVTGTYRLIYHNYLNYTHSLNISSVSYVNVPECIVLSVCDECKCCPCKSFRRCRANTGSHSKMFLHCDKQTICRNVPITPAVGQREELAWQGWTHGPNQLYWQAQGYGTTLLTYIDIASIWLY